MDSEDMDRTVSSNPFVYDQLKELGVSASVWDDVLEELFDEPFGNIPGPFGFLLADFSGKLGPQKLDYSRPETISDHDYLSPDHLQSAVELISGAKPAKQPLKKRTATRTATSAKKATQGG